MNEKNNRVCHQKLQLAHYVPRWLEITENWIYSQVSNLPADIVQSHILVDYSPQNLDQFPWPYMHPLPAQLLWDAFTSFGSNENVVRKTGRKLRRIMSRRHAVSVIRQQQIDLVHSHFGYNGWAMMPAVKQTSAKHIVTFYGQDITRYPQMDSRWYGRYKDLFAHVDAVLCEGPYMGKSIVALGCPEEKVYVQHLGVRLTEIPYRPRQWRPGDCLHVLMAASFREKKGLPYGLEALGRLQEIQPIKITIIGDANSAERSQVEKQKILNTIAEYNLQEKVMLLGYQPHGRMMAEAYDHHVFISPSVTASDGDTEGGAPVSIIEMVASGMPIVSTNHCDIPNVVQPLLRDKLAAERNVDGLLKMLHWLLANHDQWPTILQSGRDYVENAFDIKTQGQRLADIYGRLVMTKDVP